MTNLLCLLLGISIPLMAMLLIVRRAMRPVAAAAAYRNLAWRLGLEADTRGTSIRGLLDHRRIFVGTVDDGGSQQIMGVLDFDLPLGLGLKVRPRTMGERLRYRAQRRAPVLPDPLLDEQLDVRAFDMGRARALMSPPVCEALRELQRRWSTVELTDHWIRVGMRTPPSTEGRLRELIDRCSAVAREVEAARRSLPVDPGLASASEAWTRLAARIDLTCLPELPALVGRIGGDTVQVRTVRIADGFRCDVRVIFADHPALGLQVHQQTAGAGQHPGRQDIVVGDVAFDEAFVVQGYDPEAIRALLAPPVRQALMDLTQLGVASLTDRELIVAGLSLEVDAVEQALASARRVVEAVAWSPG